MASGGKRGGGDRILESRHLIGLFLGVVLLCGVFFTLGYVMGRTQYGGSVHAETLPHMAEPASMTEPAAGATPVASVPTPDWDFSSKHKDATVITAAPAPAPRPATETIDDSGMAAQPMRTAPTATVPAPVPAQTTPAKLRETTTSSKVAKGSIVLQVAALTHPSDATWMVSVLQKKHFHAFVVGPLRGDALYHVQVGPYPDEHAAEAARTALDHDGFKVIIKR